MSIMLIVLLVFAVVFLVLIVAGVQVSQKAVNIVFLLLVIFMIVERGGWFQLNK